MSTTDVAQSGATQDESSQPYSGLQAAIARTATRSIALYFSRPVRLFRPSKVSGWHTLRGLAMQDGSSLSPSYLTSLVRTQGFVVIPKHFIPPMLVNAVLGTVLWTTYAETSSLIEPHLGHHPTFSAALSGSVAGGAQALVAAPAENVRLLLEGGTVYHGWSHAWKEVFRGTSQRSLSSRKQDIQDMRQVRLWMKEVGEMAGRGWDGVGYGVVKDMCGFAAFFAIFEVTRRFASDLAEWTSEAIHARLPASEVNSSSRHISRTVHGVTLVSGGVLAGLAYEYIGRPFDHARRIVHLHEVAHPRDSHAPLVVFKELRENPVVFFRNPSPAVEDLSKPTLSSGRQRLLVVLRALSRVGPWGIGFLAWEAFGPGLHQGLND
ncbi:hypothetical protein K435DRAFT_741410 [Dendrothele bispora CBS 962.96]|uniref:Mitochondrial carrier n=1 Tax=Dendrothele bispora (strain CBS 962.96) TaxID=1314807 RepID=A0A4S8MZE4_DENBC|nr:hypothetical protein K435DRAFT_741410 [Dendrothele bispora CBS 962.96]